MTSTPVRAQMLQRAAHLLNATQSEEAWHLVGLYQQTHPRGFLHICHRILASFLELTHDYFDQGWPLTTRLVRLTGGPTGTQRSRRHRRQRTKTTNGLLAHWLHDELAEDVMDEVDLASVYHTHICMSPAHHVAYYAASPSTNRDVAQPPTPKQTNGFGKLRTTLAAKRLFKQILPSRPRTPSTVKLVCLDRTAQQCNSTPTGMTTGITGPIHPGPVSTPTNSNDARVPSVPIPFPHASSTAVRANRPPTCQSRTRLSATDSCCNTDSLICRSLIEYMLDSPGVCATEGLFRIPGNAQRIRDLWFSLRGFFQAPYIRVPQPDPEWDIECDVLATRWDLSSLLDAYSPHDLATLLLRCLTTCSQSTAGGAATNSCVGLIGHGASGSGAFGPGEGPRNGSSLWTIDETGLDSSIGGLIHPEAGELCFLATQLQYGLEEIRAPDQSEDWMHMLCEARQLLTYRIVLQLLLPNPERLILFDLLRLFKQVSLGHPNSRMSAECLARCTAVAVFGAPGRMTTQHNHPWSVDNPLRWRIDTLTNLIHMVDDLDQLPGVVYGAVRDRLRVRLGHSPIPRCQYSSVDGMTALSGSSGSSSLHEATMEQAKETVKTILRPSQTTNVGRHQGQPVSSPTVHRSAAARASLHRAKSSLDSSGTRQRSTRILNSTEPFKLWRRQKTATSYPSSSSTSSGPERALMKAQSVLLFSPQKLNPTV